jgi:hypothetical protein
MKYKIVLLILCCGMLAVQMQSKTDRSATSVKQGGSQSMDLQLPPDRVTYEFLFRHVANLELLADQKDQDGKDSSAIRNSVRDDFGLADVQAEYLKSVAFDCLRQAQQLDQQARQIIDQTRALYPKGQLAGKPVPKCPAALYALQAERNNAFLAGRLRLQLQFGDAGFAVFDNLVKQRYSKDIHKGSPHVSLHN